MRTYYAKYCAKCFTHISWFRLCSNSMWYVPLIFPSYRFGKLRESEFHASGFQKERVQGRQKTAGLNNIIIRTQHIQVIKQSRCGDLERHVCNEILINAFYFTNWMFALVFRILCISTFTYKVLYIYLFIYFFSCKKSKSIKPFPSQFRLKPAVIKP